MKIEAEIGGRLGLARKRAGLSQGQVAGLLGVSKGVICQWEQGVNIPHQRLSQMSEHYDVSDYWLQTGRAQQQVEDAVDEIAAVLDQSRIGAEGRAVILEIVKSSRVRA